MIYGLVLSDRKPLVYYLLFPARSFFCKETGPLRTGVSWISVVDGVGEGEGREGIHRQIATENELNTEQ